MQAQQRSSHEDRAVVDNAHPGPALSLKARETASLSLKPIFEQQIMISAAAAMRATSPPSHGLLQDAEYDQLHAGNVVSTAPPHIHSDHHLCNDQLHVPAVGVDLDLRLAAPASYSASHYTEDDALQRKHQPNVSVITEAGKTQLTIFYAGMVGIYEDIPADKARAIMLLAAGSGDRSRAKYGNADRMRSRPATPPNCSDHTLSRPAKVVSRFQAELPFARKASLTRFLEKRKERVELEAQADTNKAATSEPLQKRPCTRPSFSPIK